MKMTAALALAAILSAIACASAVAEPASEITAGPTARRDGDSVRISFSVSASTDVEVAILNGERQVVRHLAAGVLGGKTPPPEPLKAGLSQSLEWDGLDDYGQPVKGGPLEVRVSLGLKPEFDGFMFDSPRSTGRIDAMAIGPKGKVYVFHKDEGLVHWWSHKIKILDRDGKHLKVLSPYPADIDPNRIKALVPLQTKDGDLVPHIYQALKFSFYPEHRIMGVSRHCGSLSPAVDKNGRVYWMAFGPRLACLDADGGVPHETFLGPPLLKDVKDLTARDKWKWTGNRPSLAVSGDSKHVYFAGLSTKSGKTVAWLPCVYRVDIKTRGPAEAFVGNPDSPGKEKGLLIAPRGLAVANGFLYVGDPGADRVVVFREADSSYAGEIKVKRPHSIGVDPETDAVYVCSYTGTTTAELVKFDSHKSGKELYRLGLRKTGMKPNPGVHRIAVDASALPVRIWMPSTGNWGNHNPTCIEDTGKAFVGKKVPSDGGGVYRDLTDDRRRGELYVKHGGWLRIDGKTGKIKARLGIKNGIGAQLVPAPDGSLITQGSRGGGLYRFDRNGKPLNWPGLTTSKFNYGGIMNFMQRNLAVKGLDEIYEILPPGYLTNNRNKKLAVTGGTRNTVDVLGAGGKPKRTAVWQCTHGAILRVDHKGNIYVADMVTPPGRTFPEFFDGKIKGSGSDRQWLNYLYGSIVKFPPSGGAI